MKPSFVHRQSDNDMRAQNVKRFADRLTVWNPGALPPSLTLEKLRQPHGSVPGNPLLAGVKQDKSTP
jgi:ATP-dependent DNA helicase RecG